MMRSLLSLALLVAAAASAAAATPSACDVLSAAEIAAVQGQRYTDAKLTESHVGELAVSQCFYELPAFAKSVSVEIFRGDVDELWHQVEGDEEEHEGEGGEKGEELEAARREIEGVGEDALWSGTKITGALYVRGENAVLRISVGGPWSEDEKIAKSKKLALKILPRL